jgi:CheY-like chemotaxis protein
LRQDLRRVQCGRGFAIRGPLDACEEQPMTRPAETVLLVDDEPGVRWALSRQLEAKGYRVHSGSNGQEALALLASGVQIDLLVTDIAMPDVGGIELVERALQLRPGLPVLIMSGHGMDDSIEGAVKRGSRFLTKPFSRAVFLSEVRSLLDSARCET